TSCATKAGAPRSRPPLLLASLPGFSRAQGPSRPPTKKSRPRTRPRPLPPQCVLPADHRPTPGKGASMLRSPMLQRATRRDVTSPNGRAFQAPAEPGSAKGTPGTHVVADAQPANACGALHHDLRAAFDAHEAVRVLRRS